MSDYGQSLEDPVDIHWQSYFQEHSHSGLRGQIGHQPQQVDRKFLAAPMNVKDRGAWVYAPMHAILINLM